MEWNKKIYEDYKYILQDAGSLSLGAKYSYRELLQEEDVPFKFKVIAQRYLSKDLDPDTTLESQIYYLTKDGFVYECFRQLKTKVRFSMRRDKKGMFGRTKRIYTMQTVSLKEFVEKSADWKKEQEVLIQEIVISKLALMTFSA